MDKNIEEKLYEREYKKINIRIRCNNLNILDANGFETRT